MLVSVGEKGPEGNGFFALTGFLRHGKIIDSMLAPPTFVGAVMPRHGALSMSLDTTQQFLHLLRQSKRPLIVLPETADVDAFAAASGLSQALQKLEKPATIVSTKTLPEAIRPLLQNIQTHTDIPSLHDLTIHVDLAAAEVASVEHHVSDGQLHIHVTPKGGTWKQEHVRVQPSDYRFDLIICLGAADLAACGSLVRTYGDFFYHTPIINIDHTTTNEHFGHLNLVDVTAAAVSEVCHSLVEAIDHALMDAEMATAFLTGMIAKTKSFRSRIVSPKTLEAASRLLHAGARREEIIHRLYRTRSVATLRLWGRALARLKQDASKGLVWTILSHQDFMHAGAAETDLPEVIDELIASSPMAQSILLLFETEQGVQAILRCLPPKDALAELKSFSPIGTHEEARAFLPHASLIDAEKRLLAVVV